MSGRVGVCVSWLYLCVPGCVSVSLILGVTVSVSASVCSSYVSMTVAPGLPSLPALASRLWAGLPWAWAWVWEGFDPTGPQGSSDPTESVLLLQSTCWPEPHWDRTWGVGGNASPPAPNKLLRPLLPPSIPISVQCVIFYDRSYIRHNQIYGSCIL